MKNFALIVTVLLSLTSCKEAYETLSTPFKAAGEGIGLIGSTVVAKDGKIKEETVSAVGAYEISVKAPPGSVANTAVELFHKEARKACGGANYKHKITHTGSEDHIEYLRDRTETTRVPTVKGLVICNEELENPSL